MRANPGFRFGIDDFVVPIVRQSGHIDAETVRELLDCNALAKTLRATRL